jgi:hypothetical protein
MVRARQEQRHEATKGRTAHEGKTRFEIRFVRPSSLRDFVSLTNETKWNAMKRCGREKPRLTPSRGREMAQVAAVFDHPPRSPARNRNCPQPRPRLTQNPRRCYSSPRIPAAPSAGQL